MDNVKKGIFKKIKLAIFSFEEYINFANEKLKSTFKYIFGIITIVTLLLTFIFTYMMFNGITRVVNKLYELPNFEIKNNELICEKNERFETIDDENDFGIVFDAENSEYKEAEISTAIILLKNKMVIKLNDTTREFLYEELGLENITKDSAISFFKENENQILITIFLTNIIIQFIFYTATILIDILMLSVITFLINKIVRANLTYEQTFKISVYSITLPVLLNIIYISLITLKNFELKYFDLAYDLISYVYVITAIMMIKCEGIKQQIELIRIKKVQEQIRDESQREREEEEQKETKKKKEKDDEEKTSENKEVPNEG